MASSCGSPTGRSPSTSAAASCTSTPCIRLDASIPTDPDAILAPPDGSPPRTWSTRRRRLATTAFRTPDDAETTHSWPIDWGPQLDIRPLALAPGPDHLRSVAAYLAKYATKSTEPTGLPITGRMTAEAVDHYSDPDTHIGRLIAYA